MVKPGQDVEDITTLLRQWSEGDAQAGNQLFELIYPDLRRIVGRRLENEAAGFSLQTREIIHETYLRMVDQNVPWENRRQFFAVASNIIRRVIIDHVRRDLRQKRGGHAEVVSFTINNEPGFMKTDWLALDEALEELAKSQELGVKICELHYFAGLTFEEVAKILGISRATATRHWRVARAFLKQILEQGLP